MEEEKTGESRSWKLLQNQSNLVRTLFTVLFILQLGQMYTVHNLSDVYRRDSETQKAAMDTLTQDVRDMKEYIDTMKTMHPYKDSPKKWRKSSCVCRGTFLGFLVYGEVDTTIVSPLRAALVSFDGPKVRINSLKRHWGTGSDHEKGRAVDFEFCDSIIQYLVSDEGKQWLTQHNLMFYIEGRPGCGKVKKYDHGVYAPYVFYNPRATGPHIHVEMT